MFELRYGPPPPDCWEPPEVDLGPKLVDEDEEPFEPVYFEPPIELYDQED